MPSDDDKARKNAKKERNSKIASTSTESLAHGKWRKEEEKEKKTTNHNYREKCCVQR